MNFEWDRNKAELNLRKHGVAFTLAARAFLDPHRLDRYDTGDFGEDRWLTIGVVAGRELAVVYTIRGENIRIISARKAERHEREDYWNR